MGAGRRLFSARAVAVLGMPAMLALVVALTLTVRWRWAASPDGPLLLPEPDAVEYAATAHSLAQAGKFYLQVGPYQVRPGYSPGWPLVLAPAVLAGVPGEQLWRMSSLAGAALAALLAAVAAAAVRRLNGGAEATSTDASAAARLRLHGGEGIPTGGPETVMSGGDSSSADAPAAAAARRRAQLGSLVAGLLAGGLWALAPVAVAAERILMSDSAAAVAGGAALLCAGRAFLARERQEESRRWWARAEAAAALGGFCCGLVASMRPIGAVLLAAPMAILLAGGARLQGLGPTWRRGLLCAGGALIAPLLTAAVLSHSRLSPWRWTGYDYWAPEKYAHLRDTFNLRYALEPHRVRGGGEPSGASLPHLEIGARILAGLPGLPADCYLGLGWPMIGWLCAVPLGWIAWRRDRRLGAALLWVLAALAAWVLGYLAVFGLYFFTAGRFYLPPLAVCLALLATACGLGIAAASPWRRWLAAAGAAVLVVAAIQAFLAFRALPGGELEADDTRAQFAAWSRLSDAQRAGREMPFDPLRAQALGLLPPNVAAGIKEWGDLPDTFHVARLRKRSFQLPD